MRAIVVVGALVNVGLFCNCSVVAETVVLRGATQGTTYHIKFVQPAKAVELSAVQSDVDRLLTEIDREMSTYRPDSEISQFNRAPANEWFAVSKPVAEVILAARESREKSHGAMDVTVGALVRLWHFSGGARSEERGTSRNKRPTSRSFAPPSEQLIATVRKKVGYALLEARLEPPALRKKVEGSEIDLSSIASGYTIDHLSELLASHGIANYMVELGGEVRAAGMREDGTPWRVAIERPIAGKEEFETAVPLVNAALATAGGTHKYFVYEGRRYSHIIDPAAGRPVEHSLASVTVAADSCIEADGWDTPLLVLGPERGMAVAEANGLAAMFVSRAEDDAGGNGNDDVRVTSAWKKRFGDGRPATAGTRTGRARGTRE